MGSLLLVGESLQELPFDAIQRERSYNVVPLPRFFSNFVKIPFHGRFQRLFLHIAHPDLRRFL